MYEPIRTFVFHWCSSVSDWKKCNQGTPSFGNRSTKDTSTTPRGYIRRHLTDSIRSKDKHKTSKHFYLNPEAVFSQGRITCWTFFLSVCLQNNICKLTWHHGFWTQKIQITKNDWRNAFLAKCMRRMPLMSPEMKKIFFKMRQNVVMQELVLHGDALS